MRVLFILFFVIVLVAADDSIPFNNIKRLHFRKGSMTRARRTSPIMQQKCVGGDACDKFEPEVIACKNVGKDNNGFPMWKCEAQMEDFYRLGTTDVSCEGYSFSGDPIVLTGSCGVEYTLHLTQKGKDYYKNNRREPPCPRGERGPPGPMGLRGERGPPGECVYFNRNSYFKPKGSSPSFKSDIPEESWENSYEMLFYVVCATAGIVTIVWILTTCCSCESNETRTEYVEVENDDDVPVSSSSSSRPFSTSTRRRTTTVHNHHHNDGPGFWTGYVMGGGLSSGERASQTTTTNNYYPTPSSPSPPSSQSLPSFPSPSSYGSGSGSGLFCGGGGGGSSKSYTSTGYGGSKSR